MSSNKPLSELTHNTTHYTEWNICFKKQVSVVAKLKSYE